MGCMFRCSLHTRGTYRFANCQMSENNRFPGDDADREDRCANRIVGGLLGWGRRVSHRDDFTAMSDELTGNLRKQNDSVVRTARTMAGGIRCQGVTSAVVHVAQARPPEVVSPAHPRDKLTAKDRCHIQRQVSP
jgi:hypothetical protein